MVSFVVVVWGKNISVVSLQYPSEHSINVRNTCRVVCLCITFSRIL